MFVNLSSIVRYGEECYNSVVFYTPHRLCWTRQAKAATFGGICLQIASTKSSLMLHLLWQSPDEVGRAISPLHRTPSKNMSDQMHTQRKEVAS